MAYRCIIANLTDRVASSYFVPLPLETCTLLQENHTFWLQDLLPNTEDSSTTNLTMNTVLQCAIDFLTARAGLFRSKRFAQNAPAMG